MADTSSVYKICPHCGQSVSVAAKFCPTCGTRFPAEAAEFVAYERYSEPIPEEPAADETMAFQPVTEQEPPEISQPGSGFGTLFAGPDHSGGGSVSQPRPLSSNPSSGPERPMTLAQEAQSDADSGRTPPPMGGKPGRPGDGPKKNVIMMAAAAVILVAVIVVGVVLAFQLGIVGEKTPEDPMTLAQEAFDQKDYEEAISQLQKLMEKGNATADAYKLLAESYDANGDAIGAAETYLNGYKATQDGTLKQSAQDAYLKLGDQAQKDGDNAAAKEYYNTVLEQLDPSNSAAIAGLSSLGKVTLASAAPSASGKPTVKTSPDIAPPSPTTSGGSGITEREEAVATPTPTPSPSPSPKPSPSPSPKPSPSPSPSPKPSPSPSPSPFPSPSPTPEPTTFELNGHEYELVVGDYSWWDAKETAESMGGHLVTTNSEEEFNKCAAAAEENGLVFLWLNAIRGDWDWGEWNNGESFDYAPWYDGEPSGGDEEYLAMFSVSGTWYYNDATNVVDVYTGKKGFIVEYE